MDNFPKSKKNIKINDRRTLLLNYLKIVDFWAFKFCYLLFSIPPLPFSVPAASLQGGEGIKI